MRFGLDLGGTKMEAIVMDGTGQIIWRQRAPTPAEDYAAIVQTIGQLVEAGEAAVGARVSVGIGMPGSLSPKTGWVRNSNTLSLNGQPLRQDLEARLGREVRLANDANCFALSEATDGAGQDAQSVFGVILGTGCGGGLVFSGQLQNGVNGIGGEWGHNPLAAPTADEVPGPACYCGRHGCNEVWISGSGFARDHNLINQDNLSSEAIIASDTPAAQASFERLCDRLARALGAVINLVDPEVIVLGGGLSNVDALYQRLPQIWDAYIFSDVIETQLKKNQHGDSSGVRGAAWLWPNQA
ncbi:MAG: ROK family protein [Rhodobiaceae bacterium]|jgi:fructokinase|nr:ROK family protein [Rhodobiaceae bacterium]MBT7280554.1 ROK family protein [Rhodobiaceae bacterium]